MIVNETFRALAAILPRFGHLANTMRRLRPGICRRLRGHGLQSL